MTEYATTSYGDRVAYDRRGDGPGLVFIAGAGPYREIDPWTTQTAARAAELGLTTVVFDRLGRGESPADGTLGLDRELAAVAAMMDAAGGAATLCGHSSGCAIALAAAEKGLPVGGLALWEGPLAGAADDVHEWIAEFERRLDAGDVVGATEQYMKDMPPEWLDEVRAKPFFEQIAAQAVSQRADGQALVWATAALEANTLGRLSMPVLAMYGTSTFPEMPIAAKRIAGALPSVSIREMPGADHAWEPEPMAAALAEFVRSGPSMRVG